MNTIHHANGTAQGVLQGAGARGGHARKVGIEKAIDSAMKRLVRHHLGSASAECLEARIDHQIGGPAAQGFRQSGQAVDGDVLLPALDQSDVVAVHVRLFGQLFLGMSLGQSAPPDGIPKPTPMRRP